MSGTRRRWPSVAVAAILSFSLIAAILAPGANSASAKTYTIRLDANGYVLADISSTPENDPLRTLNFAHSSLLEVGFQNAENQSIVQVTYVRFPLMGNGTALNSSVIASATLRMYANSTSSTVSPTLITVLAHQVGTTGWNESTLDYNNAPKIVGNLSSVSLSRNGTYYSWDVTNATRGVSSGGEVTVALAVHYLSDQEEHVLFSSRSAPSSAPEVIVVTGRAQAAQLPYLLIGAAAVAAVVVVAGLLTWRRRKGRVAAIARQSQDSWQLLSLDPFSARMRRGPSGIETRTC